MAEFKIGSGTTEDQLQQFFAYQFAQASAGIATTGVLSGLTVTQTTTASADVLVNIGAAVSQPSLTAGADVLLNNAQKTLNVLTANPMGATPRNDLVVFDPADATIKLVVGTPNAVPTDPTPPTGSVSLARLRHLASATTVPAAQIDDLRSLTVPAGTFPKPLSYTSVGGAAPVGTIGNAAGTILQTLTIPAVTYARKLNVAMSGYIATTVDTDSWEVVGTVDSAVITVGVCGRSRVPQSASGSGAFSCLVDQPANTAKTLRVWVRRVSGTGTGTGSTDETYTRIDVVAHTV